MKNNQRLFALPFSRIFAAVLLTLGLAGLSGCLAVAAGAGAGAYAYVRGDLEANLNNDYNKVVDSARNAIKDLEFARVSENKDALKAVLVARTALDKKVEITVTYTAKKLTNIKIRVGLFGDEQLSISILEKIRAGL